MSPLLQLEDWYFMTNNDNHHHHHRSGMLVLGEFHSIAPKNTAGDFGFFVKPINQLPDRRVDIRRIPSATICSRISVLAPPGHHKRSLAEKDTVGMHRRPQSPRVDHDSSGAVVSTQSSIQCLLTRLYKTTMPVGLDGLPLSMCERCATATGKTVVLARPRRRRSPFPSASRALR
jgi:hypothetical protein